jgi:ubiquinone/menaquinone biosynthesis C-methylase UbiE
MEGTVAFALDPEENESRVIHELVDFRGKSVFEIGSGEGRLSWRVADAATSVLAIDPNEARIGVARRFQEQARRSNVTFQVADVTTVEIFNEAFDVAILSWSI